MATDATEAALEKEHEERTKVKNIDTVQIGKYQLDTWYYSPYPDEVYVVSSSTYLLMLSLISIPNSSMMIHACHLVGMLVSIMFEIVHM
jgi:histone acetyltransferase MYST1